MFRILSLLLFCCSLLFGMLPFATQAQTDERCFGETNQCIRGAIRVYWETNGGLPVFGYPITAQAEATVEGRTLQVQWFERDRLEIQPDGTVTAGRLGVELLERQGRPWETLPQVASAPDGCTFFGETRHSLCEPFRSFWQANGGVARMGLPISEPFLEEIEGRQYTVQYYERRRVEVHPELPGSPLLMGLLGREVLALAQPDGGPQVQPTPTPPVPVPPTAPPAAVPPVNDCQSEPDPDTAANFPVQIVAIDKRAEVVVLVNLGEEAVNLDGWRMCSLRGDQEHPIGGTLQSGEVREFRNSGETIWSNTEQDNGALYNEAGVLISYWRDPS